MHKTKYQRIPIIIPSKGAAVKFSASTDKLYEFITGIAITLPWENSFFGTSLQLKIAGEEIFPEYFEAKILGVTQDVSANERFYTGSQENPMMEPANGQLIEGVLLDGSADTGVTFPYTAMIYVRMENIPEKKEPVSKEHQEGKQ